MKIALYSPYLDTAGGGEKYMLTIAEVLSYENKVDVLLDTHLASLDLSKIKEKIIALHGLDLSLVNFIKAPLGKNSSFLKRALFLKNYDHLFYLTDGSIFFSTAKNSYVHFQVPFVENNLSSVWGKFKLSSWNMAIYNSFFTKEYVEKAWNLKGKVIYPPVSIHLIKPLAKEKYILSVGRFFGYLKDKKHQVLIDSFRELAKNKQAEDWSLYLVGGLGEGDKDYLEQLKSQAKGINIEFYPNASLEKLITLYGSSSIYWHASGFGETDPKRFEHFGITTVEAMAGGAVPIVINLGGQKEIIEHNISGLLWDNLKQLNNLTLDLIKDEKKRQSLSKAAVKRSKDFSKEKFINEIKRLVYDK